MSKEFYAKLAEIQRTLNAPKNQYNIFGKYKYRICEDILEGVKPLLNGLFLSISDEVVMIGSRYYVRAVATITDGESTHTASALAREEESKKGMDSAQVTGATSSYARKYCLNVLFDIDDSKDADTDELHHQSRSSSNTQSINQQKQRSAPPTPDQVLHSFTTAVANKDTVDELKTAFGKAWEMLKGTEQQAKAEDVYEIRKSELEGVAA
ncbi:ERF family protein [Rosenbergiella epipactidis]|uniref:ERF family protein n=1 Tax=Rosenbergiella epipactidis TaxID=1544694 RepID=UPI000664530C|nr:ERF family protein [Rosenbergiella epipactidis]KMV68666.1 recombinase [bacteria symbiont BFo2 of Frankliniella occidentalis]KYP87084.1 recombinase [bacteria symbiont BFo2 of Frankliniella occidentalis]KYP94911.1 recombinase [bacteria symbiont BFo2 of Frankliniella occidentalis]